MNGTGEQRGVQALVVGAGPVGLAMAGELARLGVRVRIVDKAAERSDKSKALVLWPRTLELMRIMGCAERFVSAGLRVQHAALRSGRRELARIGFGGLASPYRFAVLLPQSETERLLEEHLAAAGVRVERRVELTAFEAGAERVTATLRRPGGREERLRCDWLVGCDGAHSTVRHALGFSFEGETEPNDWLLADVRLEGPVAPDEVAVWLHRSGVLALFPMSGGRFRLIADMGARVPGNDSAGPTLSEVQAVLDLRGPGGVVAREPVWLSRFGINERKVREYRAGRVFLAGDAAHIHSPAGGQGMNTGIQDACNLAWKLALVCGGAADPQSALLGSYGPERSPVAEHVLRGAAGLTRMGTLRNPVLQLLRNLAIPLFMRLPAVRNALAATLGELDIAYRGGPLSRSAAGAPGGGLRPGQRVPDADIRTTEGSAATLYAALGGGRFVVLAGGKSAESGRTAELLGHFGAIFTVAYVEDAGALQVVRPDGYLGLKAGPQDWDSVAGYFRDILAPAPK